MKNRELVANLNGIYALREREQEREKKKEPKIFAGVPLLIISRNLRALEKEYNENYVKDLQELRGKYYVKKETEVTVPADKESGVEEHKEKREIEVLRPDADEAEYNKELNTLLDLDVSVPITRINIHLLEGVTDARDADAVEFMVDYGVGD